MTRLIPALLLCILAARAGAQSYTQSVTNYGSGISLTFSGTPGVDWAEEYFWHNRIEDDHKVVYIKSSTIITMSHNENNIRGGQNSADILYIGADGGGQIRYRVDRDLQWKYQWAQLDNVSGTEELYPAYTGPFSFGDLEYSAGNPVVGTIGGQGSDMTDRENYYFAGCLDEFGDEWHTIAFADDDSWAGIPDEHRASDGKTILFVVNPKTPCIYFTKAGSTAQFYSTPPKAYFVPRVHSQITYLTDDVEINLVNIMGGDISYRFDDGAFQTYTGPLSSGDLSDGEHVLEYYYDTDHYKTRTIIKNPSFPSDGDAITGMQFSHGRLFFKDDAEIQAMRDRMGREPYSRYYPMIKDQDWRNGRDKPLGQGKRVGGDRALENALIGLIDGFDHVLSGDTESVGSFCKKLLLDNKRKIDPLAWGDCHWAAKASRELNYRGYYDVNLIFSLTAAYDFMIRSFRSSEAAGGITPIEDHKIRDMLARFVLECMTDLGNYGYYSGVAGEGRLNAGGFWGAARDLGALVVSLAMPSYDTHYYGTAGWDGTPASHLYTPFPNHPVTWKDAFYAETNQLYTYPDQSHRMGLDYQYSCTPEYGTILTDAPVVRDYDGRTIPAGSFRARVVYYSRPLMGHCYWTAANALMNKFGTVPAGWAEAFANAQNGEMYGAAVSDPGEDVAAAYFPQVLLVNERFPELAGAIRQGLIDRDLVWNEVSRSGAMGLILYHDDWEEYTGITDRTPLPVGTGLANPVTTYQLRQARAKTGMQLYTLDGEKSESPATGTYLYVIDHPVYGRHGGSIIVVE